MKKIKAILRAIYLIYVVSIFFLLVAFFLPFYMLLSAIFRESVTPYLICWSHYVVGRLTFLLGFIPLKVTGRQFVAPKQTYVVVSNHQSQLDIVANALATPFIFKFLGKEEVKKVPLFGYVASLLVICINRKSKESKQRGFNDMVAALEQGYSILLYPEGTRNTTDAPLKPFYDGAFRLAISTATPILVETIVGTRKMRNPRLGFGLSPGKICCHIAPPISTKGMTMDDLEGLKEEVRGVMLEHL